jgi:hypothetical protein
MVSVEETPLTFLQSTHLPQLLRAKTTKRTIPIAKFFMTTFYSSKVKKVLFVNKFIDQKWNIEFT